MADDLRARPDDELQALLQLRPDLTVPIPDSFGQLAHRAGGRASVVRCLERLDQAGLLVLEAIAMAATPVTVADVAHLLGADAHDVTRQLHRLRRRALVWGTDDDLRLVSTVHDILGAHVGGLGPPIRTLTASLSAQRARHLVEDLGLQSTGNPGRDRATIAAHLANADRIQALLADAGPAAQRMAQTLSAGTPMGRLPLVPHGIRIDTATTPSEQLLARGLLIALDATTVVLPREVGLALRGGVLSPATLTPPDLATRQEDAGLVDQLGAGAAAELLRLVDTLAEAWARQPATNLRAGGLGVRELRRAATLLTVDEPSAAFVAEAAYAAGLVALDGDAEHWLPSRDVDAWRRAPAAERWSVLASAWVGSSRVPSLAMSSVDPAERPPPALSPELDRPSAVELRQLVLRSLAELPAGHGRAGEDIVADLAWRRPRLSPYARDLLVHHTLDEAARLGLVARGALTSAGRALVAGDVAEARRRLEPLLPAPLDHVLIQGDLTAIAPGPLEPEVAREMALLADVESAGSATVYRFSERSVRRALDAGRAAAEIDSFLDRVSQTPVPQPLRYLVTDVARRHGRLRAAPAYGVLVADDPALLDRVMAAADGAGLLLRRVAPSVVTAQTAPELLAERLEAVGIDVTVEEADGTIAVRGVGTRRAAGRGRPRVTPTQPPAPPPEALQAVVRALRAGDRGGQPDLGPNYGRPRLRRLGTLAALQVLERAVRGASSVWILLTETTGATVERLVDPSPWRAAGCTPSTTSTV